MKILAIEKEMPGINDDDYFPFLKEESSKVWELYQSGFIRELYFANPTPDQNYAVLMLECVNLIEARNILNMLPLVKEGLIDFELIPLSPYTGFKRLFSPG